MADSYRVLIRFVRYCPSDAECAVWVIPSYSPDEIILKHEQFTGLDEISLEEDKRFLAYVNIDAALYTQLKVRVIEEIVEDDD